MPHGMPGKRKRGNKPKYVYSTQQEVVAHRRAVTSSQCLYRGSIYEAVCLCLQRLR